MTTVITLAIGRISRVAFSTDATQDGAPIVPLGYMLEGAWTGEARWLGMIGRTRLTPAELDAINLSTWKRLETPFGLLNEIFDTGWEAPWGDAGAAAQAAWSRSAVEVTTDDVSAALSSLSIDTAEDWTATCNALFARLDEYQAKLFPIIKAPVVGLVLPSRPERAAPQPTATRTQTDIPLAA